VPELSTDAAQIPLNADDPRIHGDLHNLADPRPCVQVPALVALKWCPEWSHSKARWPKLPSLSVLVPEHSAILTLACGVQQTCPHLMDVHVHKQYVADAWHGHHRGQLYSFIETATAHVPPVLWHD